MNSKNAFLSKELMEKLTDREYEAIFLLVRILSSLQLERKLFLHALYSGKYRNFEIIEINSRLLATYTEAAKAYANTISEPLFSLRGLDFDDFTANIRDVYCRPKADTPIEYKVLSFIRDTTTFHFHGGYIARNKTSDEQRIAFMGFIEMERPGELVLTNTIPHILEEIQKITGRSLVESTIAHYYKELNDSLVYPFIEYIENLAHSLIDKNLQLFECGTATKQKET